MDEATTKQIDFINKLMGERVVPQDFRDKVNAEANLNKKTASLIISTMLTFPKAVAPKAPAAPTSPVQAALAAIPHARYAIDGHAANLVLIDTRVENDMIFVETREYRETHFLRQLHGAPGDFVRSRLSTRDTLAIAALIATDPLKFVQAFGAHYSVCGKCAAPLTDEVSRSLNLGPECRKAFGL